MKNQIQNRPAIFIDLKKNRIRIYKHTLQMLGKPDYIQLLVNPADRIIAVRCTDSQDHLSHKIYWDELLSHKSCE